MTLDNGGRQNTDGVPTMACSLEQQLGLKKSSRTRDINVKGNVSKKENIFQRKRSKSGEREEEDLPLS
jgi:hypothetical protein